MIKLNFEKFQGLGNDFIIINNRDKKFSYSIKLVKQLCDRRFGIGADGILLIENSDSAYCKMVIYNSTLYLTEHLVRK